MTINLKNNRLIVTFKFNPRIIQAIRVIPGRKFDVSKKRWEVPVENIVECVETLSCFGVSPTMEVKNLYNKQKSIAQKAEEIKVTPALYTGDLPLFEFQKIGASFMKSINSVLLADAPGLGKTIQTIAALEEDTESTLVLCPASLKYSWKEEIEKWSRHPSIRVIGGDKFSRNIDWINSQKKYKWIIANYELLLRDWDCIPKKWKTVVCDEATRISNPSAKTTKLLKKIEASKKIALTGTPISNSPNDIYSIIDWICPGHLGSYWYFLEKYCIREPRFNRIVGYRDLDELGKRISRFLLRRVKEEVLKDLPSKITEDILFDISPTEKKLYIRIRNVIKEEMNDLKINKNTVALIPVKMLRLKQITDHPSLITGKCENSSKLETLMDIIRPIISSGEKVIIFTQFSKMAKILYSELNIYNPRMIVGETETENRQIYVNEFNNDKDCMAMIMTEAGAYGLNLQAASYVIHYDFPWSVAKLTQREDRAHRIGQTKPVTVYNLIAKNTIDEYVKKVLYKKQKISVEVLQDKERLKSAGLDNEDIREILKIG